MFEFLRIATGSVLGHKLRSGLTLLGIVIGVWAITSMQAVVKGFDKAMENELSALGSETFFVQKFPAIIMGGHQWWKYARRKDFTYEDALYLQDRATYILAATATVEQTGQMIKYQGKKTSPNVKVIGTMADFPATNSLDIAAGRFITEDDVVHARQVAILGRDVADELFPFENPLEKRILVGNQAFVVAGVQGEAATTFEESADNVVVIPVTSFQKLFSSSSRTMDNMYLALRAVDAARLDEAIDETVALLRVRRKVPLSEENDFEVHTAESLMSTLMDFTKYIRIAAIGIAGISLLVAGIGIMNIMLVSVMERTREIGTRKAVGARRSDILWQFLIEAVLLSEIGAGLGLLLSGITAMVLAPILKLPTAVPPWAMVSALIYCSAIGIFFGLYPANKASRLDPIEALRYE